MLSTVWLVVDQDHMTYLGRALLLLFSSLHQLHQSDRCPFGSLIINLYSPDTYLVGVLIQVLCLFQIFKLSDLISKLGLGLYKLQTYSIMLTTSVVNISSVIPIFMYVFSIFKYVAV